MRCGSLVYDTMQGKLNTGVYCFLNLINGKTYVGSASGSLRKRFLSHVRSLRIGKHCNQHLQSAWNRYGEKSFTFVVLQRCDPYQCIEREQYWIDQMQSADRRYGYNKVPTAGSVRGLKHSKKTKRRLSKLVKQWWDNLSPKEREKANKSLRGRKLSEVGRARLIAALTGRRHTKKTKTKMSSSQKDAPWKSTDEQKAKLREAWKRRKARGRSMAEIEGRRKAASKNRGRKRTEEQRARMSAAQSCKPKSAATKAKIALTLRGRKLSARHRAKISSGLRKSGGK